MALQCCTRDRGAPVVKGADEGAIEQQREDDDATDVEEELLLHCDGITRDLRALGQGAVGRGGGGGVHGVILVEVLLHHVCGKGQPDGAPEAPEEDHGELAVAQAVAPTGREAAQPGAVPEEGPPGQDDQSTDEVAGPDAASALPSAELQAAAVEPRDAPPCKKELL